MNTTALHTVTDEQMSSLSEPAHKVNRLGLNFLAFTPDLVCCFQSQAGAAESDSESIGQLLHGADCAQGPVWLSERILSCPLDACGRVPLLLVVDTGAAAAPRNDRERQYLDCIVRDIAEAFSLRQKTDARIDKISGELSKAYEEIMLLYNLSTHMKVSQSNSSYLQMACDQLSQLVPVEGIAIFLERKIDGRRQLGLTAGSGVLSIDPGQAEIVGTYLSEELHAGREALLDSTVDGPFKYNWPSGLGNIIAVPLGDSDRMIGFLAATNALNKPDFDTTDIKLFTSVANQCMVFIENNHLFDDLKELFIGSLKALTNSIDAKDQYTRGHSERVAFISRWIGERLAQVRPISQKQLHHIYLAGLLHDIGKIGVSESVLRKRGGLSEQEWAAIQAHPRIGASILSEIRQMDDIVPGVMSHHERMDGAGYPQGLRGEQIPLIARIISLADAFDAMTSKRVYRDALSIRRALAELEKGIGTQFDEQITRVFLDSDIDKLWKIIQDGYIESWDYSNFDEYGVQAVGALLR